MQRSSTLFSLALGASLVVSGFGTASRAGAAPQMTGIFTKVPVLGVDVTLRYDLQPSDHPGGEDDSGPYLKDGAIGITAGPNGRTKTLFTLETLHVLQPNGPQIFPSGAGNGCGAAGAVAGGTLASSKYPAIVVTTVYMAKGCLPLAHVFVPASDTSETYTAVTSFRVTHPPRPFLGMKVIVGHPDAFLVVKRVRTVQYPSTGANIGWPTAIVSGNDIKGVPLTIALDRPSADELPAAGETISIFKTPATDMVPVVRLSADHERLYQKAHPAGSPLATPPPPPMPPTAAPIPTPSPSQEPVEEPEASPTPTRTPTP